MIVVIGSLVARLKDDDVVAAGTTARVALAAASAGRSVQLVGRTGDDPAADGLLQALARRGVGHVALLRDPAHQGVLDAADVELGLRYLIDFAVLILAEPAGQDVVRVVAEAARWNAARLVMVVEAGTVPDAGLPSDAIVFEAPADDRDGVFATMVGSFAAALDTGGDPGDAFRSTVDSGGWTATLTD